MPGVYKEFDSCLFLPSNKFLQRATSITRPKRANSSNGFQTILLVVDVLGQFVRVVVFHGFDVLRI